MLGGKFKKLNMERVAYPMVLFSDFNLVCSFFRVLNHTFREKAETKKNKDLKVSYRTEHVEVSQSIMNVRWTYCGCSCKICQWRYDIKLCVIISCNGSFYFYIFRTFLSKLMAWIVVCSSVFLPII